MEAPGWFGPYQLLRPLDPARLAPAEVAFPLARRWAAVHERHHSGHLVYSLGPAHDRFAKKRFLAAAEALGALRHPHLLTIDAYALSDKLGACLVAAYPGHHGGVVTLDELLEHKGGTMPMGEVQRALTHLLEGLHALHSAGLADGALGLDRVHVDPRGSLLIELPGLWRAQRHRATTPEDVRADIRAVAAMGRQMLLGSPPAGNAPRPPQEVDPRWRAWIDAALDPVGGFASASGALQGLPAPTVGGPSAATPGLMRNLLGKIRSVMPLL